MSSELCYEKSMKSMKKRMVMSWEFRYQKGRKKGRKKSMFMRCVMTSRKSMKKGGYVMCYVYERKVCLCYCYVMMMVMTKSSVMPSLMSKSSVMATVMSSKKSMRNSLKKRMLWYAL
jgi:hypothetical protein